MSGANVLSLVLAWSDNFTLLCLHSYIGYAKAEFKMTLVIHTDEKLEAYVQTKQEFVFHCIRSLSALVFLVIYHIIEQNTASYPKI